MNYQEQINKMMNILIPRKEWMSDEDYQNIVDLSLKHLGTNMQRLSNDIEEGVSNGHSVEDQIDLLNKLTSTK
jgi:hypothetical protein